MKTQTNREGKTGMNIIKSEYVSFEEYKQLVDKYVALDNRGINFQDRIVLQLIDRILANSDELSVVDVHAQYKNRNIVLIGLAPFIFILKYGKK